MSFFNWQKATQGCIFAFKNRFESTTTTNDVFKKYRDLKIRCPHFICAAIFNPFKNITGYDKINFCNQEGTGVVHNIIQEDDSTDLDDISTTYTYNSNDYPITSTETGFEVTTAQYFYN